MTSSYRDPNVAAALAYQAEQEQRRKAQEQPSFLDIAGRTALGLGVAALAGAGIARGLRRNAVKTRSMFKI
jgi:TnpA family transposase